MTRSTAEIALLVLRSGVQRWLWLTEPSAAVRKSRRDQARLLAGLLLTMCCLGLISAIFLTLTIMLGGSVVLAYPILSVGMSGLLLVIYQLNRTGHYMLAATLLIMITTGGIWAAVAANPAALINDSLPFAFLSIPVLLCSLLLSVPATITLAAINLGVAVLVQIIIPERSIESLVFEGIFVATTSALIIVSATIHRRNQAQILYQNQALTESGARFHAAFAHAAIGMALVSLDDRWMQVNAALCRITGYSEEELLTTTTYAMLHPDDRHADRAYIRQLLDGEIRHYAMEQRYTHKLGHVVWILLNTTLVFDAQSQPLYFITQIQDITERHQAESTFRGLIESAPDAIVIVNQEGLMMLVNTQMEQLFGYERATLLGKSVELLIPESLRRKHVRQRADYIGHADARPMGKGRELYALHKDGTLIPVEIRLSPIETTEGQLIAASIRDVTDRRQAATALQHANQNLEYRVTELQQYAHLMALLSRMGGMLQICQSVGELYQVVSQYMQQLFPDSVGALYMVNASRNYLEPASVWGNPALSAEEHVFAPEDCWALRRGRMHQVEQLHVGVICRHVRALADPAAEGYLCFPIMAQGDMLGVFHVRTRYSRAATDQRLMTDSKLVLATTAVEQVTLALANLKLRETLRYQSIRDPLTGLFNRRYMQESLEREIRRAERKQYPVGVIMADIDYFKRFNDNYGHEAGDTVLRTIGDLLSAHIRAGDIACRYGGEELTLILPESPLDATIRRAEQLRQAVEDLMIEYHGQTLDTITLSLGVATFPDHGTTAELLLRAADAGLYCAKQEGRNRVMLTMLE